MIGSGRREGGRPKREGDDGGREVEEGGGDRWKRERWE